MISIVIPTYEMGDKGTFFIKKSLEYISNQTFKDFEVVISDHSIENEIKIICEEYPFLDIVYLKNEVNRGSSSSNLNNAILNSKYDLIKFLMQDEYLIDKELLSDIVQCFQEKEVNWIINGCLNGPSPDDIRYEISPYYSDEIIYGKNTIGSPSCVSIRKTEDLELFNKDLIWMMDCDYYKRLFDKWGYPKKLNTNSKVFINHHEFQLTNTIPHARKTLEHEYLKNKYKS